MVTTLTAQQKGILLMSAGLILLLFSLGILEKILSYFIIAGSLAMIVYGLILSGYIAQLMKMIKKK